MTPKDPTTLEEFRAFIIREVKHVGDGLPGWHWKPYTPRQQAKGWSHIETKAGLTFYQCLRRNGHFNPLLDDRTPKGGISESEVAYILELDA